ncbi:MAG TPA: YbfB/YjiJ family MFS transporter [Burkholderiales bacterium]
MERSASRTALTGLAALAVAMGVGRFAFTPILPMMQADAGVSLAEGGWLASANYAGYLAGALWAAAVPVRPDRAIRFGLLAIAIATIGMGLDGGFAYWIALRAIAGIASAWVLIHISVWCLGRLAAAGRAALSGTVYAGVGSGVALAGVVCLVLMQRGASSAQAWILLAAISLVLTALLWPAVQGDAQAPAAEAQPAARDGLAWRLIVAYGAYGIGYIIPATYLPVMAREVVADPALFGWAWPVFGAAAAASTLAVAQLGRRFGHRRLWLAAQLVLAAGVAAPVVFGGVAGILLAALCVGSTFVVITMEGMQVARELLGARGAPLMAAMTAAFAAGQIAGPAAASLLVAAGGRLEHALIGACMLLLASVFLLTGRTYTGVPRSL